MGHEYRLHGHKINSINANADSIKFDNEKTVKEEIAEINNKLTPKPFTIVENKLYGYIVGNVAYITVYALEAGNYTLPFNASQYCLITLLQGLSVTGIAQVSKGDNLFNVIGTGFGSGSLIIS